MIKYKYFEALERISALACDAVSLACGSDLGKTRAMSEIRKACDGQVCELEDTLFSDFLPPLERDNIAACAHSLSRVVDKASDLLGNILYMPSVAKANEEGRVCVRLAESLRDSVQMLRHIRKPDEMPDIQGFRNMLSEGRAAHCSMLSKLHSGSLPRSCAQGIIMTGRLRSEISRSFDELVEIMLNNI